MRLFLLFCLLVTAFSFSFSLRGLLFMSEDANDTPNPDEPDETSTGLLSADAASNDDDSALEASEEAEVNPQPVEESSAAPSKPLTIAAEATSAALSEPLLEEPNHAHALDQSSAMRAPPPVSPAEQHNEADEACEKSQIGNGKCDWECNNQANSFDGDDCKKLKEECPLDIRGNGVCDQVCNKPKFNFDAGDCPVPPGQRIK